MKKKLVLISFLLLAFIGLASLLSQNVIACDSSCPTCGGCNCSGVCNPSCSCCNGDDCLDTCCDCSDWVCGTTPCGPNGECGEGQACQGGVCCDYEVVGKECGCCSVGDGNGDCFLADTKIATPEGEKKAQDIKEGEELKSLNPETNQESTETVQKIFKFDRFNFFKIKLKGGQEIEVTPKHPLYVLSRNDLPQNFWEYLKTQSLIKKTIDYLFK